MALLISYLLKMLLCSGVLYTYYYAALRNNRFHQWNRYYLLLATLLSITLPLLQLPIPFTEKATPGITAYTAQMITLREFILTGPAAQTVDYLQVLYYGYGMVALLLLGRIVYGCWKIRKLIRNNPVQHLRPYRFVQSDQVQAPFSFFRYIFWARDLNPDSTDGQQILQHELAHVTEQHSMDKLVMELVCAICWINPFFHLFKRELAVVHEFVADQQAAAGRVADYAQTILQASLQSRHLSFTNSFFHPPIKRRINMLLRQKSKFIIMKKLITFPIIAALIIFIGCQQHQEVTPQTNIIDIAYEDMATIDAENVKSISITNDTALLATSYGKIYRAYLKGSKLDLKHLKAGKTMHNTGEVFTFVEQPPTFPGGEEALGAYLSRSIRYPKEAVEKNITGTVFVQFVVGEDGAIRDARIVGQPKGGGLEAESLRVVENMPKWIPGEQQGRRVAVQFNLPIRYTLSDEDLSLLQPFMLFKKSKNRC